ncbi:hypothetical protein M8J76_014088 [Diaphorina citri]|nr:hypothetical protein M8J76_014088 [Diaphorina citri]
MGGSISAGRSNAELVHNLATQHASTQAPQVEELMLGVDRRAYFLPGFEHFAYQDLAWKHNLIHLSAPVIYWEVLDRLQLKPGLSFLNLGSGTGYLSTMAGLVLGASGVNHGIELHQEVIDFALLKLEEFKMESESMDRYDFCEPVFVQGNCLNLPADVRQYDRVGGILVMPYRDYLVQIKRTGPNEYKTSRSMQVAYSSLQEPPVDGAVQHVKLLSTDLTQHAGWILERAGTTCRWRGAACQITIRQLLRASCRTSYPDITRLRRFIPKRDVRSRLRVCSSSPGDMHQIISLGYNNDHDSDHSDSDQSMNDHYEPLDSLDPSTETDSNDGTRDSRDNTPRWRRRDGRNGCERMVEEGSVDRLREERMVGDESDSNDSTDRNGREMRRLKRRDGRNSCERMVEEGESVGGLEEEDVEGSPRQGSKGINRQEKRGSEETKRTKESRGGELEKTSYERMVEEELGESSSHRDDTSRPKKIEITSRETKEARREGMEEHGGEEKELEKQLENVLKVKEDSDKIGAARQNDDFGGDDGQQNMRDVDRNIERSSKDKNGASNSHQNEQALDKNIASKDKSRASQLKDHKEIDKYQNTTRNDRSSPKNSQRNDRNIPRSSHQTEKSPDSVNRQNQGSSRNASRRANVQKYIDKEPLTKLESARKFKQLLDDITERNGAACGATGSDRNKMSSSDESICDQLVDAHDNNSSERTTKVFDKDELIDVDSEESLDSDTLLDDLGKRIDSRKQHHDIIEGVRRKDNEMGTHNDSKPHDNSCDKVSKVRDIGPDRMLCDSELDNKVVHSGKESPSSDPSASVKAIGGKGYNSSDRQANSSTERQANNSTEGQANNSTEEQAKNSAERQGKNSSERKGKNSIEKLSQYITESPDSHRTSHPIENHSNLRSNQTEEHRPGVRINQNMDSETRSNGAQIQNMDSETRSNGAHIQIMDSETRSGDAQIQNMDTETCSDGAQIQNMDSELPPAEVAPFKREKFDSGVVDDEDTTGSVDSGGSMDSGVGTHTQPGPQGKDPYRINHDTIDYLRRWLPDNSGRQTLGELFGDGSVRFGASGRAGQSSSQNSQSETRESSRDKPGENRESGESSGSRASGQDSRPCSGKSGSQSGARGSPSGARQSRTEMSGPDDSPYPTYAELQRIKRNALNSDRDISGRSREEPNENDKTRVKNDREWNVEGGNLQKETSGETNVSGDARKSTNDSSRAQSPNASPKDHRMHGSDDESFDSKRKYTTDSDHGDDESEASGREKAPRRSGGKKNKKFKDRNSDAESRGEAESHGEADLRGEAGEETSARRRNVRLRFLDEERESREAGLFEAMRRDGLLQFFDQPASTPVPQFVRALRNGMDEGFDPLDGLDVPDSEEEVVEDEEEVEETDDTPTYATLMREKIRELPLPNSVKLYLNFNRAL